MPKRKKATVTCIAQYLEFSDGNHVSKSIYLVTFPSDAPKHIEVQCLRGGEIQAKIIEPGDLKGKTHKAEINMINKLLRENRNHGTMQVSDVLEKAVLGIEIVTQATVARLARRHPAGAGYRDQDENGDCDCNGGD
jgi:hypothetical protein